MILPNKDKFISQIRNRSLLILIDIKMAKYHENFDSDAEMGKGRDLFSSGIFVPGLSRRFSSRSQLSRGFESRSVSLSRGFAGPVSRPCPGTIAHPCLDDFVTITLK